MAREVVNSKYLKKERAIHLVDCEYNQAQFWRGYFS